MDFNTTLAIWKNILSHPGEAVFVEEREKGQVNLGTAVIWMIGAALFAFIIWALYIIIFDPIAQTLEMMPEALLQSGVPQAAVDEMMAQAESGFASAFYTMLILGLISVPVFFLIGSGVFWIIARILGGEGSYTEQTYLMAAYSAPLFILNTLFNMTPLLGPFLVLAGNIYAVALTYYALKVTHDFPQNKAVGALALPLTLILLFACCSLLLMASTMGALLGQVPQ